MEKTVAELDEDEIEKALGLISKEETEIAEKKEELPAAPEKAPEISIDDITRMAVDSYNDVRRHADDIYDAFYDVVATRQDRSDMSKQMLADSQRLKIESINALASLASAKAKLIQAQNRAASGNVGVFIQSKTGDDVGINLKNLED